MGIPKRYWFVVAVCAVLAAANNIKGEAIESFYQLRAYWPQRPAYTVALDENYLDQLDAGETLYHRISVPPGDHSLNYRMPLSNFLAVFCNHYRISLGSWNEISKVLELVLTGILAYCLSGAVGACLAMILIFPITNHQLLPFSQSSFLPAALLTLIFLVRRAGLDSFGSTVGLSIALGFSLLCRSTLALFPPLLAVVEALGGYISGRQIPWKRLLILIVVPYLFLMPWIRLNWVLSKRIILFENGPANSNIAAAALGLTYTIEGKWSSLINGNLDPTDGAAVIRWAIREIFFHPVRFVIGFCNRLRYVLMLHPVLLLAAFGAVAVFRKRRPWREAGYFLAYFVIAHCAMAVREDYFIPLWPAASALAAAAAVDLAGILRNPESKPNAAASAVYAVLAGALVLLCIFTGFRIAAYAAALQKVGTLPAENLESAIASHPTEEWLIRARGLERMRRRDIEGAADDFNRALTIDPQNYRNRLDLAAAEIHLGRVRQAVGSLRTLDEPKDWRLAFRRHFLSSFASRKEKHDFRRELAAAVEVVEDLSVNVHGPIGASEEKTLRTLRDSSSELMARAQMLLDEFDVSENERKSWQALILEVHEKNNRISELLSEAEAELKQDPDRAAHILDEIPSTSGPQALVKKALMYQGAHEFRSAAKIFSELSESYPGVARYRNDLGVAQYLDGQEVDAARNFAKTTALDSGFLPAYLSLGSLYERRNCFSQARGVYDRALREIPAAQEEALVGILLERVRMLRRDTQVCSLPETLAAMALDVGSASVSFGANGR